MRGLWHSDNISSTTACDEDSPTELWNPEFDCVQSTYSYPISEFLNPFADVFDDFPVLHRQDSHHVFNDVRTRLEFFKEMQEMQVHLVAMIVRIASSVCAEALAWRTTQ